MVLVPCAFSIAASCCGIIGLTLAEGSSSADDGARPGEATSKGSHISGQEGLWRYLKRWLAAKGSIRQERLPLYLAEYVWRYNHRHLSRAEQVKRLLKLLHTYSGGWNGTLPFCKHPHEVVDRNLH